jgi:predicted glycosyltransferase
MRFVVDILHPAHVHFFRNFISEMITRGHEFLVTARDKECAIELLDAYGIPHVVISRQAHGLSGLGYEFLQRSWRFFRKVKPFRPDYLLGIMGPTIAVVGRLLPSKTVIFYDTEFARISNWFAYPLADYVCTPECYQGSAGTHQVRYPGYHELAYLHPNRFTPNRAIRDEIGLNQDETLFIMRFVSWEASHDVGEQGLSYANKLRLVEILSSRGRLFISSEAELPEELKPYRLPIPVYRVHHLMAQASLLVGESATMASECAVLGVPAVFISKTSRGYIDDEQARYGLALHYTHEQQEEAIAAVEAMADDPRLAKKASLARQKLLAERIDVTAWMVNFFERRP